MMKKRNIHEKKEKFTFMNKTDIKKIDQVDM